MLQSVPFFIRDSSIWEWLICEPDSISYYKYWLNTSRIWIYLATNRTYATISKRLKEIVTLLINFEACSVWSVFCACTFLYVFVYVFFLFFSRVCLFPYDSYIEINFALEMNERWNTYVKFVEHQLIGNFACLRFHACFYSCWILIQKMQINQHIYKTKQMYDSQWAFSVHIAAAFAVNVTFRFSSFLNNLNFFGNDVLVMTIDIHIEHKVTIWLSFVANRILSI